LSLVLRSCEHQAHLPTGLELYLPGGIVYPPGSIEKFQGRAIPLFLALPGVTIFKFFDSMLYDKITVIPGGPKRRPEIHGRQKKPSGFMLSQE
jgi:hypothetical protein